MFWIFFLYSFDISGSTFTLVGKWLWMHFLLPLHCSDHIVVNPIFHFLVLFILQFFIFLYFSQFELLKILMMCFKTFGLIFSAIRNNVCLGSKFWGQSMNLKEVNFIHPFQLWKGAIRVKYCAISGHSNNFKGFSF